MKNLAIFVDESSLFASPYLAEALNCNLYVIYPEYNDFFQGGREGIFWDDGRAIKEENIIIVGYNALMAISDKLKRFKTVAVILSDSWSCRYHEWINEFVKANNLFVYAMPDKIPYFQFPIIPAFQTFNIKQTPSQQEGRIVIAHSPGSSSKMLYKGTALIERTIKKLQLKYDIEFILIKDVKMNKCLELKSKAHIFIDQVVYFNPEVSQDRFGGKIIYEGGIGKSGLEAMMLGSCVITGVRYQDTEPYIPYPPVVSTSGIDFYNDLEALIVDGSYRTQKAAEQKKWAEKYLSPEFVSKHLTQHL